MTLFGKRDTAKQTDDRDRPPKWSTVNGKSCDMCVAEAYADVLLDKTPPRVSPARWRRQYGPQDHRLRYQHANEMRRADEERAARYG